MKTLSTSLIALTIASPLFADEINIYSSRQPVLLDPIIEAYEAETGNTVNVAHIEDGLVERLAAEGEASPADLVMVVDVANLTALKDRGVLQAVDSDLLTDRVPEALRDADNEWFGVTQRARIVYASKERVAEGEVTTYEDLADPKWKGRICTRSGLHNYNVALTSAILVQHGSEEAEAWLSGLRENLAHSPDGNDRAQVKSVWAGECDIAIGNSYYMGLMLQDPEQAEWANAVNMVFPTFEDGGTHTNVSGVAMTKSAEHTDAAKGFMEFLVSDMAQEIYAEANNEYPVVEGVSPSELVASWGELNVDDTPLAEIGAARPDAVTLIQKVDYDR